MNPVSFRQHAAKLLEDHEKKKRVAMDALEVARKRASIVYLAAMVGMMALGAAFLLAAPWFFVLFFVIQAALWSLYSVEYFRAQRRAMKLGFLEGVEWEMGVWSGAIERAAGHVHYTGESSAKN